MENIKKANALAFEFLEHKTGRTVTHVDLIAYSGLIEQIKDIVLSMLSSGQEITLQKLIELFNGIRLQ